MRTLHRIVVPLVNAFFITAILMYLMFYLIRMDEPSLSVRDITYLPPFTNVPEETEVKYAVSKPPEMVLPEDVPEIPKTSISVDLGPIENPGLANPYIPRRTAGLPTPPNNQLILALGYPPAYPNSAIQREIEGYAIVGFSVSASGAVFDPFIIESEPNSVFDRSALKAISKFKYKAKMIDGKPVTTAGQRYLFRYELDSQS